MEEISLEQQISNKQKELRERIDLLGLVEDGMDALGLEEAELRLKLSEIRVKVSNLKPSFTMATRNVKKTRSEIKELENDYWKKRNS